MSDDELDGDESNDVADPSNAPSLAPPGNNNLLGKSQVQVYESSTLATHLGLKIMTLVTL